MIASLTNTEQTTKTLVDYIQQLSFARSADQIVAILRLAARELTGADGATIVLRDGDLCHYVDENAITPLWKHGKFPMSACISGWAMLNKKSVSIANIKNDPRIPYHLYEPTFVRSLVMVPIRTSQPIGAIGNYWAQEREPKQADVEILQVLANSASIAFENVSLYNTLQGSLQETQSALTALTARTLFFANISHEIRNPLQSVIGLAEIISDHPTPEEQELCVSVIRSSGQHLMNIANDFLDMAKIEAGKFKIENKVYEPQKLIKHMVEMVVLRAREKNIKLTYEIEAGLPSFITGDPQRIQQIILNLLSNAIKFTRKGTITLKASWNTKDKNGIIRFTVQDTGIGIAPEKQKELFQHFNQLNADHTIEGTGLGLTISRQLVTLMGGEINFESMLNHGTTFTVSLPAEIRSSATVAPSPPRP